MIWTLLVARVKPAEILRRIRENEAGLGKAYDLPRATYFEKQRKLKLKRGDPRDWVDEGQEPTTVEAIERMLLSVAKKEARELDAKRRSKEGLSQADLNRASRVADMTRKLKTPLSPPRQGAKARAGKQGGEASQSSPLTALGQLVSTAPKDPSSEANADSEASPKPSDARLDDALRHNGLMPSVSSLVSTDGQVGDSHAA